MNIIEMLYIGIINIHTLETDLEGTDQEKIQSLLQIVKDRERKIRAFELAISTLPMWHRSNISTYLDHIAQDAAAAITIDVYKQIMEEQTVNQHTFPKVYKNFGRPKKSKYIPEPLFKNDKVL